MNQTRPPLTRCLLRGYRVSPMICKLLRRTPDLLITPTLDHASTPVAFSTLSRWDWHTTPPTCYYMKDREIFSQSVGRRNSVIFLDVRETTDGERYVKVTQRNKEKGNRNSDYVYVGMEDFSRFNKGLKAVEAGKDAVVVEH